MVHPVVHLFTYTPRWRRWQALHGMFSFAPLPRSRACIMPIGPMRKLYLTYLFFAGDSLVIFRRILGYIWYTAQQNSSRAPHLQKRRASRSQVFQRHRNKSKKNAVWNFSRYTHYHWCRPSRWCDNPHMLDCHWPSRVSTSPFSNYVDTLQPCLPCHYFSTCYGVMFYFVDGRDLSSQRTSSEKCWSRKRTVHQSTR